MAGGAASSTAGGQLLGRYELHGAIARGGMATVYVARMSGAAGFTRTVAIKRLHPHLAADPTFAAMFVDEARLAARIRHPNVIDTLDVVNEGGELFLVMDFVLGETLAKLVRAATKKSINLPPPVVSGIVIGALEGLHAAHEATNERGDFLGIVHRDVSPQNILIARDGVARMLDFGVAKATGRIQETEGSEIKGKLAYMSPEQLTRKPIDRRCDIFAMGVVLWEALTSRRLFAGEDAASTLYSILSEPIAAPSTIVPVLLPAIDDVVMKALERDPDKRFATARDMALALEAACLPAPQRHAGKWVEELAGDALRIREQIVRAVDGATSATPVIAIPPGDDPSPSGSGSQRIHSSARLATPQTGPESWRHLPAASISQPGLSGMSGVSGLSGVSGSGVSRPTPSTAIAPIPRSAFGFGFAAGLTKQKQRLIIVGLVSAGVLITILVMVIGMAAGNRNQQRGEPSASAASSAGHPPAAVTTVASPTPTPTPTPAVTDEPAPAPAPSAQAPTATAVATPTTPPVVRTTQPVIIPPKPKSATPPPVDCENPFTIDANGIRRPKPQCFGH